MFTFKNNRYKYAIDAIERVDNYIYIYINKNMKITVTRNDIELKNFAKDRLFAKFDHVIYTYKHDKSTRSTINTIFRSSVDFFNFSSNCTYNDFLHV